MTYVVTRACALPPLPRCVIACPSNAFRRDERMFYIHPDDCVDCDACAAACPAEAIYDDVELPEPFFGWRAVNAARASELPEFEVEQ